MLNIDNTNNAVIRAHEAGELYCVLVVRCTKTGGRFVSVRSVTPYAFNTGLVACAKDQNFGAYNSPILESFRKYGSDGHSIYLHSSHTTRVAANKAKKELVEKQAVSKPEINLNWNRPVKRMPVSDFRWLSEDEVKAKTAKLRSKKRSKKQQPVIETAAVA